MTASHIVDFILEFSYRVELSVVLRSRQYSYLSQVSFGDSHKIRISVVITCGIFFCFT